MKMPEFTFDPDGDYIVGIDQSSEDTSDHYATCVLKKEGDKWVVIQSDREK